MMAVRRTEQNTAATIGQYGVMIQLDHPSSAVKSATEPALKNDLKEILAATRPDAVYTHNPADKHDTHIGVSDLHGDTTCELAARPATEKSVIRLPKSGVILTGCRTRKRFCWT